MKLIDCPGCAERREKIKAQMKAMIEWAMNPDKTPNPTSIKLPPSPQIIARSNKSKTEKSP